MNLIDYTVLEVLSKPEEITGETDTGPYSYWVLKVRATSYGVEDTMELTFGGEGEALEVKVGYRFDA